MPSGGARARSGPAPDPNALRRERDHADWIRLPAQGRQGATPAWPLSRPTVREQAIWTAEWTRPQAVMWELNRQEIEVALYVRNLVRAEKPSARTDVGTLLRQQQEALGLSLPGLARNRWVIDSSEQQDMKTGAVDEPGRISAKTRFRTIEGGSAS